MATTWGDVSHRAGSARGVGAGVAAWAHTPGSPFLHDPRRSLRGRALNPPDPPDPPCAPPSAPPRARPSAPPSRTTWLARRSAAAAQAPCALPLPGRAWGLGAKWRRPERGRAGAGGAERDDGGGERLPEVRHRGKPGWEGDASLVSRRRRGGGKTVDASTAGLGARPAGPAAGSLSRRAAASPPLRGVAEPRRGQEPCSPCRSRPAGSTVRSGSSGLGCACPRCRSCLAAPSLSSSLPPSLPSAPAQLAVELERCLKPSPGA